MHSAAARLSGAEEPLPMTYIATSGQWLPTGKSGQFLETHSYLSRSVTGSTLG